MGAGWRRLGPIPGELLLERGGEGSNSRVGRVSVPPQNGEDSQEAAVGPPRGAKHQPGPLGPWKNWFPPANLFP